MACYDFGKLVQDKCFVSIVRGIDHSGDEPVLLLDLYDTSDVNDVNIASVMIAKNYAKLEESSLKSDTQKFSDSTS